MRFDDDLARPTCQPKLLGVNTIVGAGMTIAGRDPRHPTILVIDRGEAFAGLDA